MHEKTVTLVIRLWHRPEGIRAEIKHLKTGKKQLLKGAKALLCYLELAQEAEVGLDPKPILEEGIYATKPK